jgi:predicted MFS family arabinose efflux permease
LNNSALYLGIAIGAALGGLLWNIVSLTVLAWAGSGFVLLALISLLWSMRTSAAPSQNPELKVSSD